MSEIAKDWFVSSLTTPANNCVEVRLHANGTVDTRNSNDREGPMVSYTRDEWKAFIGGAKNGEFDFA